MMIHEQRWTDPDGMRWNHVAIDPEAAPAPKGRPLTPLEGVVGIGLFLIFLAAVAPMEAAGTHKARNAGVQANLNTVRMALEQYATDHNGHYPRSQDFVRALCAPGTNYLPGDKLPRGPWSKGVQTVPLGPAYGLPSAREYEQRQPKVMSMELGSGRESLDGANSLLSYGAVVYDMNPATDTYVIYGIGKKGSKAIVAAFVSNGGS